MNSLDLIKKHEGLRLKVYDDSEGIATIGVGRNLEAVGITESMAMEMLAEDMESVFTDLSRYQWYNGLNEARQAVVENMMFNLGSARFSGFKKTLKYISDGDFLAASKEMLDSKWARQVGNRADELSLMMETGKF